MGLPLVRAGGWYQTCDVIPNRGTMPLMKLRTALVFGIGYVLGSKAGRDRYEQMRRLYRRTTSNERVRQVIDQGKNMVDSSTAQVRDMAADQLRTAGDAIRDRVDDDG